MTDYPFMITKPHWGLEVRVDEILEPEEAGLTGSQLAEATSRVIKGHVRTMELSSFPQFSYDFISYETGVNDLFPAERKYRILPKEEDTQDLPKDFVKGISALVYNILEQRKLYIRRSQ
ncbi:hypothetical protein JW968_04055 [Candidatus Woesearchaeota archaeon]|nr:hypothetical protein [Candidatus Woesearchaeota archaeon]